MHKSCLSSHTGSIGSAPSKGLSFEKMEDDLTCPVCLELYADPLMMPCSHSICKTCLNDIMRSRTKSGKQDLECPACRETHQLTVDKVNKLPKNLALENIVFRYQEIRSFSLSKASTLDTRNNPVSSLHTEETTFYESDLEDHDTLESRNTRHCGLCEDPEKRLADWYCEQCQVLYCQICLDTYHPKRGSLNKHKIRKPTLQESVKYMLHCSEHITEPASIFCNTCKVVACHLCICQGQGSHCSHFILDLTTAREQLKASLQSAQQDLSTLISSFINRDAIINAHIQEVKTLEESAKSNITSQYNCILSDFAATLNVMKQKYFKSIETIADLNLFHLTSQSQQISAMLAQCQNLSAACGRLMSGQVGNDKDSRGGISDNKNVRTKSNLSALKNCRMNTSDSSNDEIFDCDKSLNLEAPKNLSLDSSSSLSEAGMIMRNLSQDQWKWKSFKEEKCVGGGYVSKNHHTSSYVDKQVKHESLVKQLSSGSLSLIPKSSEENIEKPVAKHGTDEKFGDFVMTRKSVTDRKNSARKLSGEQEIKLKHVKSDSVFLGGEQEIKLKHVKSDSVFLEDDDCLQVQEKTPPAVSGCSPEKLGTDSSKPEDEILLRAEDVAPVLEQVALIKESQLHRSGEVEDVEVASTSSTESKQIMSCISDFHTSSMLLISCIADFSPLDHPVITPTVRSMVSLAQSSQAGVPRVQSRTLITWGFNSTTFTADSLENNAQWSVSINKNATHIGDIQTGYLFGIGVSSKPLSSKEQVGMTPASHAIACIGGQLVVCHDSIHNPIMPLSELPLSVILSIAMSKSGLVMAYKVLHCDKSQAFCGKRVIALDKQKSGSIDDGKDKCLTYKVHPVFTVSQRVKMQFPLSSDV